MEVSVMRPLEATATVTVSPLQYLYERLCMGVRVRQQQHQHQPVHEELCISCPRTLRHPPAQSPCPAPRLPPTTLIEAQRSHADNTVVFPAATGPFEAVVAPRGLSVTELKLGALTPTRRFFWKTCTCGCSSWIHSSSRNIHCRSFSLIHSLLYFDEKGFDPPIIFQLSVLWRFNISTREIHTATSKVIRRLVPYYGSWSHQLSTRPVSFLNRIGAYRVISLFRSIHAQATCQPRSGAFRPTVAWTWSINSRINTG